MSDQGQQQQSKSWISSFFGYIGNKLQNWFSPCPEGSDLTMIMYDDDGKGDEILYIDLLAHDNIQKDDEYIYNESAVSERGASGSNSAENGKDEGKGDESAKKRVPKFLGRYSEDEIRKLFEEFVFKGGPSKDMNFNQIFSKLGFDTQKFIFDIDDKKSSHRISLYYAAKMPDSLVAQLCIQNSREFDIIKSEMLNSSQVTGGTSMSWPLPFYRRGFAAGYNYFREYRFPPRPPTNSTSLDVVNIEWLRLQNPLKKGETKGYLPGQLMPSLGIITELHILLEYLCEKNGREGVVNTPEQFYNALIYSNFKRWPYKFFNPAFEGFFQSLKTALSKEIERYGFLEIAWAINIGAIRCAVVDSLEAARAFDPSQRTPEYITVKWERQEQAYAMASRFIKYFESPGYKTMVEEYTTPKIFSLDTNVLKSFFKLT